MLVAAEFAVGATCALSLARLGCALPRSKPHVVPPHRTSCLQAWLAGNPPAMLKKVVDLSIESGVVCPHTCMVAFETTPDRWAQLMQQVRGTAGAHECPAWPSITGHWLP